MSRSMAASGLPSTYRSIPRTSRSARLGSPDSARPGPSPAVRCVHGPISNRLGTPLPCSRENSIGSARWNRSYQPPTTKVGTWTRSTTRSGDRTWWNGPSYDGLPPIIDCATVPAWKLAALPAWLASAVAAATGSDGVYVGGSIPGEVTRPSHSGMNDVLTWPPEPTMSRYESPIGTIGNIALRPRGCCAAGKNWLIAPYDVPCIRSEPLLHGRAVDAAHSASSKPSRCSRVPNESHVPLLPPVPRTSAMTCT